MSATLKVIAGGLAGLRKLHEKRILMTCPICKKQATERDAAVVLFKLLNGPEGSKVGNICQDHKIGDDWHGVGKVTNIEREDVTLKRQPGALFYTHAVTTPVLNIPKVESKPSGVPIRFTKPQQAILNEYQENHIDGCQAFKGKPMTLLVEATTPLDIVKAIIAYRALGILMTDDTPSLWHVYSLPTNKGKVNTLKRAVAKLSS